jgi:hypothetical protein
MRRGTGRLEVFTFKEGLLARAAHDLQFTLERFPAVLEGEEVRADIPLAELHVVGPVEHGVAHPERFDFDKRAEIERAMRDDVLRAGLHPTARFAGRAVAGLDGLVVKGTLALAGTSAPLAFAVTRDESRGHRARFELHPSHWGIAPYRALLGAIRLKDLVRIELALREE